jgi:hypothetical protein
MAYWTPRTFLSIKVIVESEIFSYFHILAEIFQPGSWMVIEWYNFRIYEWVWLSCWSNISMVVLSRSSDTIVPNVTLSIPTNCFIKGGIYDPIVYSKAEEILHISDARLLTLYRKWPNTPKPPLPLGLEITFQRTLDQSK